MGMESYIWGGAEALKKKLDAANGKRRTRTLSWDGLLRIVEQALIHGYFWADLSTVANAYKYPAVRTCCVAARQSSGFIRVEVGVGNAKGSSSPINPVTGLNVCRNNPNLGDILRHWADEVCNRFVP